MINDTDHDVATEAALAARYRQRRLTLLVALLVVTVIPIVALGTWWLWPLLVVPAALAAPLAGGTGLIATLLASSIALAVASSGDVASPEVFIGFVAIVVVAALGAAHEGMGRGLVQGWSSHRDGRVAGPAPDQVFDIIADRDCRRAAETGSPVSVAVVAIPRVDSVGRTHGIDALDHLLASCSSAVVGVVSGSDLVTEQGDGRYVALVAGPLDTARDVAQRMAVALESVAVRDHDGLRVTAGEVAVGVAEWSDSDTGPDSLIERAGAALLQDLVRSGRSGVNDDQATGEFRSVAVADAA